MTRYHTNKDGNVAFSEEEEAAADVADTAAANQIVPNEWIRLRTDRDALLVSSDWTQVADAPGDTAAWETYRQTLRDLPANTADPANPTWPTPPG
jgi:hypothetical protein